MSNASKIVNTAATKVERKYLPTNRVLTLSVGGVERKISGKGNAYLTLTVRDGEGTTAKGMYLSLSGNVPNPGDEINVVIHLSQFNGKWSTTIIGA